MMRWVALVTGLALLAVAVFAYTRIEDTRAGLIAEVVMLLASGAGGSLTLYGVAARRRPQPPRPPRRSAPDTSRALRQRSPHDLAYGAGGIAVAAVLLAGLGYSGGVLWAGLGFLVLLPMLAGSVYLCWRAIRTSP